MADWDERYRTPATAAQLLPSPFLVEHIDRVPRGDALDVAMGQGRHTLFLARYGFRVTAVDRSTVAARQVEAEARTAGLDVTVVVTDLETNCVPSGPFQLVVVTRYLQRSLFSQLENAVAPGGVLLYETYTTDKPDGSPHNRDFLLHPGELSEAFPGLTVSVYREVDGLASLLAIKAGGC